MKEAQGELNMTVIVVTIVSMLSLFFFSYLWPYIRSNYVRGANCNDAICTCPDAYKDKDGNCNIPESANGLVECQVKGSNKTITCPWKG